jgi:ribonuclease D
MKPEQISYVFVESHSDLDRIAGELERETAIGVDLEADSMFHYHEKVCLLQISTPSQNILVDPLALEDLSALAHVFSNPGIRKVFHGADYDIRSLHRDFGIEVNPLFDTQIAATFLGIRETGLANLLSTRFGLTVEKKYQKKDWSKRPLPQPMLDYAARDALYLIPLANMLEDELRSKDRLFCVKEECERLSKVRANQTDDNHFFLKFKGAGKLDPRSLTVLETILQFRDDMARKQNRPQFKVFGNAQVKKMAKEKPRSLSEFRKKECLSPKQIKGFGKALSKRINTVLNLPENELLAYPKKTGRRVGAEVSKRVMALKKWREQRAGEMSLDPALICTNAQIQSLATLQPKTQKELKRIAEIKNWQRELFGREICSILNPQ